MDIINLLIAIIATGFAIFVAMRTRQVFRPKLMFHTGLTHLMEGWDSAPKLCKKKGISTQIFCAKIPEGSEALFKIPYSLKNESKLPITNIVLQLNYPCRHKVDNYTIKEGIDARIAIGSQEIDKDREVRLIGPQAQVCFTIPVLRVGEPLVLTDPMKFIVVRDIRDLESEYDDQRGLSGLRSRLSKIKQLYDFCVISAFIYSDNYPPISRRFNILWYDATSMDELHSFDTQAINAFWKGQYPTPGKYYKMWWEKIWIDDYGELIWPKFNVVKLRNNSKFYLEKTLESDRSLITFPMPPWNYYE